MNQKKSKSLKIEAEYLGPIRHLTATLSQNNRNILFASNGIGKSCLARAIRCLDQTQAGTKIYENAVDLMNALSPNGISYLKLYEGESQIGSVTFDHKSENNPVVSDLGEKIYHVFSEDFIHEELRLRNYKIDGKDEKVILLDRENIEIVELNENIYNETKKIYEKKEDLKIILDNEKKQYLIDRCKIAINLGEFNKLNIDNFTEGALWKDVPKRNKEAILFDLQRIEKIPENISYPLDISVLPSLSDIFETANNLLVRVTDPSSVSSEIVARIKINEEFFRYGVELFDKNKDDGCPFCLQAMNDDIERKTVENYLRYFSSAEAEHKKEISNLIEALKAIIKNIEQKKIDILRHKSGYNNLKKYIPDNIAGEFIDLDEQLNTIQASIDDLINILNSKMDNLTQILNYSHEQIDNKINDLNNILLSNNNTIKSVKTFLDGINKNRRDIREEACKSFGYYFFIDHEKEFKELNDLEISKKDMEERLKKLESTMRSLSANFKFHDTFERLLDKFFRGKYIYDRDKKAIRLLSQRAKNNVERIFSDGEKTAFAFCYFIASIHFKIEKDTDYAKIFLILDDPVNSLSYEFIYTVADILRFLRFGVQNEILFDIRDEKNGIIPFLLLTHNNIFYNICANNDVIKDNSLFHMKENESEHKIEPAKKFIAPLNQQLLHINEVILNNKSQFYTGNTIRYVLETIGKFCYPNATLRMFLKEYNDKTGVCAPSTLMNAETHGIAEQLASNADMVEACDFTLKLVEHYAPGLLKALNENNDN